MLERATREVFWNVSLVWFFYTLSALAIGAFVLGAYRIVSIWRRGWKDSRRGKPSASLSRTVADGLLNRKIFRNDRIAGLMHLCIMWGFIVLFVGTVLLTIHHDVAPFLFGTTFLVYSLVLDIAGLVLIVGVTTALVRRYVIKARPMNNLFDDGVVLVALLGIAVTGFALEGLRLTALEPFQDDWSPVGTAFAAILDGLPGQPQAWHGVIWWTHAAVSLGLVIYIPLSKLFHMFAAPTNIYLAAAEAATLTLEEREKLVGDFERTQMVSFDACTKCNRCENVCPSFAAGEPLSPRGFVLNVKAFARRKYGIETRLPGKARESVTALQVGDMIEEDAAWWCTTCRACVEECPVSISPMDVIRETRVAQMADGRKVPPTVRDMLRTMSKHNNPWEAGGSKRSRWRQELGAKDLSAGDEAEVCYWISCIASDDLRNQEVARAFIQVLSHAGVDFAHLGKEEGCCGEFVKRLGEDGLFEAIVENNYATFAAYGVSDLVTTSPHCFHTMRRDYPALREKLNIDGAPQLHVRHHTAAIADLLESGKLTFTRRLDSRVTFHDPCYIGRHNGLYEQPRRVLRALPGVELVEMPRSRENSFCCGGGGGRMWLESTADQRMAEIRVREAAAVKVDVLVTACPFCMSNLHDAAKTAGYAEVMEVRDIAELVAEAL
ncbi:MAG: 4Fe-4S dicluster domain-containing protein [Chloroflexi bacterium]|nr:4Fe-4S dicluster domain-containing protein [Chloroflexota bacterium]